MKKVFVECSNIISPLGFNTQTNFANIFEGNSGIKNCLYTHWSPQPFPASFINNTDIDSAFPSIANPNAFTRFEKLAILSIYNALQNSKVQPSDKRTLFILSTTKGNVELLDEKTGRYFSKDRVYLNESAKIISGFFKFINPPMVISNACISGVAAIILGQRFIKQGIYDNVLINGTDELSRFIVSGFQSFMALSSKPCKPFDKNRDGLTLGEGSATIILTKTETGIEIAAGATSNDANHISGPSRTGEGLLIAIKKAMAGYKNVDLISAHGTATLYNDDMESIAITRAGLDKVPVNSLKGYFGHTLGAAGLIESIINIEALKKGKYIKTLGCEMPGTVENINVIVENTSGNIKSLLKLASGFGGSNAAALFLSHG